MNLRQRYSNEVAARGFLPDIAQQAAVERLDLLRAALLADATGGSRFWRRLRRRFGARAPGHRGVYLWGGVGRGKTWLMDLFYESLPIHERRRSHFHHFMRDVHATLQQLRRHQAPLASLARRLAAQVRVLCFDELYVTDVADAMILGTLFEQLLQHGVTLVITSNVPPRELYRDGLQRARFLPAIELLEQQLDVLPVDGGVDYRLRQLRRRPIYLDSADPATPAQLAELFDRLAGEPGDAEATLRVRGRALRTVRRGHDVVWFGFEVLCDGPRGPDDYAEIAGDFGTVLLANVPVFAAPAQDDAARRFIALVDEFYDQGTKLVLSAAAAPAALYRGERLQFEFRRTASRLTEMQSEEYLARPHRQT